MEDVAEEEDEMPLLFTDGLPSDFKQNAQLAALATFMQSDDEDGDHAKQEDDVKDASRHSQKRRVQRAGRRAARTPYARPPPAPSSRETKELSLFLSMFHVSKDDER
ncbi:hypothetical protein PINS_up022660 [Pythium insidiosum]|nr:hypothetical protein PINS_up004837 [Pythium insidiosum]GLE10515.1 hypothetical protein PINS_up022660 [Pythium insidiosum]